MEMEWGWIGNNQDGVWFQGNDYMGAQYVGLGGSRYHVLGEPPTPGTLGVDARLGCCDL
jgi:hypothetical protein